MGTVTPRCKLNLIPAYISAQGTYFPCCWIGNEPHASDLKKFLGEECFEGLKITANNLPSDSDAMRKIERSWENGDFRPCVFFCGKPISDIAEKTKVDYRDSILHVDLKTKKIQRRS